MSSYFQNKESNLVGKIISHVTLGDSIGDLAVFTFTKKDDVLTYAMTLLLQPEVPTKIQRDLQRGEYVEYDENLWGFFLTYRF